MHPIPTEYVLDVPIEVHHAYVTWRDYGQPYYGFACKLIRKIRLQLNYTLRQCHAAEDRVQGDRLVRSLSDAHEVLPEVCQEHD